VPDPVGYMKDFALGDASLKPFLKKIMPLCALAITEMKGKRELSNLLAFKAPFDEVALWHDNLEYVKKSLDLTHVQVVLTNDPRLSDAASALAMDPQGRVKNVVPMEPDVVPFTQE